MQPRALARKGGPGGQPDPIRAILLRHLSAGGAAAILKRSSGSATYGSAEQGSIADCDNAVVGRIVGGDLGGRRFGGCGLATTHYKQGPGGTWSTVGQSDRRAAQASWLRSRISVADEDRQVVLWPPLGHAVSAK